MVNNIKENIWREEKEREIIKENWIFLGESIKEDIWREENEREITKEKWNLIDSSKKRENEEKRKLC